MSVLHRLKASRPTLVFLYKNVRQGFLVVDFQIHAKECDLVYDVNTPIGIIKFDAIEENGIFIQKNISTVKIAMNIAVKSLINSSSYSFSMRA